MSIERGINAEKETNSCSEIPEVQAIHNFLQTKASQNQQKPTATTRTREEIIAEYTHEFERQTEKFKNERFSFFEKPTPESFQDSKITRTRCILLAAFRVWNSFPTFAYEITKRAGGSDAFAETVYVSSMAGDTFALIGPVFSLFFMTLAIIRKPSSFIETFCDYKDYIWKTLRGQFATFGSRPETSKSTESIEQEEILTKIQKLLELEMKLEEKKKFDETERTKLDEEYRLLFVSIKEYLEKFSSEELKSKTEKTDFEKAFSSLLVRLNPEIKTQTNETSSCDETCATLQNDETEVKASEETESKKTITIEIEPMCFGFPQKEGEHVPIPIL